MNLYKRMREGAIPHTSQINIVQFENYFTTLLNECKNIIHISLGSGISGTCHNAQIAAENVMKQNDCNIIVVDSLGASLVYGMQAIFASENRKNGMTFAENVEYLNDVKHKINTYYTTSNLTYLQRGGRVSKAGAIVAHMLNINPILRLDDEGRLHAFEKVRGKKQTESRIEEWIEKTLTEPKTLFVGHCDNYEYAKSLGERYKEKFRFTDMVVNDIGSIIGSHAGPELVAYFYVGTPRTK